MHEQSEIGWSNFLEGRLSSHWRYVMDQHYRRIGSKKNGKRWTTMLIQKVWEIAWDQWEHRNGILHDHDHHLLTQRTDRLISELYEEAQSIPHQRRPAHFNQPLEETLQTEFSIRKLWLQHATNAFDRFKRREEDLYGSMRRTMQTWRVGTN